MHNCRFAGKRRPDIIKSVENPLPLTRELAKIFKWYLGESVRIPFYFFGEAREILQDSSQDKKYGIHTCFEFNRKEGSDSCADPESYQTTSYREISRLINYLRLTQDDVVADLGCGKGRVVFLMALAGVRKAIGVELRPTLATIAETNFQKLPPASSEAIICLQDAARYSFSDETIIFMFNPFGVRTFTQVIANLKQNAKQNPRTLRIAYRGPYKNFLDAEDWLEKEGRIIERTSITVWRNKRANL